MKRLWSWSAQITMLTMCVVTISWAALSFGKQKTSALPGIPPEQVAGYIHSIIQADRTVYTAHVVNRLQNSGVVKANEQWQQQNALLLPAQFLQLAGRLVAEQQHGIRYRLVSLWPIYRRNGPSTEFERKGLEAVHADPTKPYTGVVTSGQQKYFQAVYADRAVSRACIDCHNAHPLSPKRDFQEEDVMGGIVITIPLGLE